MVNCLISCERPLAPTSPSLLTASLFRDGRQELWRSRERLFKPGHAVATLDDDVETGTRPAGLPNARAPGGKAGRSPECVRFFKLIKTKPNHLPTRRRIQPTRDAKRLRLGRPGATGVGFSDRRDTAHPFSLVIGFVPSQSSSRRTVAPRVTIMILTQVHLRKPCYDFYFL